jgi:hypothetical protein
MRKKHGKTSAKVKKTSARVRKPQPGPHHKKLIGIFAAIINDKYCCFIPTHAYAGIKQ